MAGKRGQMRGGARRSSREFFGLPAALALSLGVAACSREVVLEPPEAGEQPTAPKPRDRLAKNELLEGAEKAFGLTLPRDFHVDHAFADVAYAKGPGRAEAVIEYLRTRVVRGVVRPDKAGGAGTVFEQVQVPSSPGRDLSIRVTPTTDLQSCELEIRDVTPPSDIPPTEAERWRAAGLAPDGRILDPSHLH